MYPETKGVPLEEMDAVFGEGAVLLVTATSASDQYTEERLDYESERASLMSNARSDRLSVSSGRRPKANNPVERGWVSRVLYRNDRSTYEPIGDSEE